MKSKLLPFLTLCLASVFAFAISACGNTHNYGEWVTEKEPTCTEAGKKYHACTDEGCNYLEWKAIPTVGHNYSKVTEITTDIHTVQCSMCHSESKLEQHNFEQGCCKICDYEQGTKPATVGLHYYLNSDKNSYTVQGTDTRAETEIVIPSTYHGLPVTIIDRGAFMDCTSLISVTIPDSIAIIESDAFNGCTSLTNIILPESVTAMGMSVFEKCYSLKSIIIPSKVTHIYERTFYECTTLTSIIIPDSVTIIGEDAFLGCISLTIYCEAEGQPEFWSNRWNSSDCPVSWGYTA